jgi:scyllo-inositol 2-dehydrogenase (NAD+)
MTLNVGVAGVGLMGRRHAHNIAALWPRARLVAVADINRDVAQVVARDLDCDCHADPYELLARSDIDAVVIVTRADTHAPLVTAAAEQGKDILVEKPLALTLGDARSAIAAAERAGVRLQVGFMRRYDPPYRQAHLAIERGELGTPVLFSAISRDAKPPPRSYFSTPAAGGLFLDSGVHDFDLARWLMRDEVASVSASGAVVACHDLADVQPIDAGVVTLTFRRGATGTVQLYRNAIYGYDIRTEVLGTESAVMVGDQRHYPVQFLRRDGITHTMADHWLDRFAEAYALEMADWVERMSTDQLPAVTGEDGLRALEIALAAEQSRQSGQVVTL